MTEDWMMLLVTAKITAKPGQRDKIIENSNDLVETTRKEPGCMNYDLYSSTEDENILMVLEKWENKEALDTHTETDHFQAFGQAIEDMVAEEMEVTIYQV